MELSGTNRDWFVRSLSRDNGGLEWIVVCGRDGKSARGTPPWDRADANKMAVALNFVDQEELRGHHEW